MDSCVSHVRSSTFRHGAKGKVCRQGKGQLGGGGGEE